MTAALLHPKWDPWFLGGLAIVCQLAFRDLPEPAFLFVALPWLLLAFSYPHFAASYLLFYKQPLIMRQAWFTAWLLPLLLSAVLAGCICFQLDQELRVMGQVGLLLLYWHYAKQAFGASLWLMHGSASQLPIPKPLLLAVCLTLGGSGYISLMSHNTHIQAFGLYLPPLDWPLYLAPLAQIIAEGGLFLALGIGCYRAWSQTNWAGLIAGAVPLVAFWSWMEPASPWLLALVPIFHGLQYFPFAWRVWLHESRGRLSLLLGILLSLLLGGLLFRFLPRATISENTHFLLLPAALLFLLNTHHYFIDAHMWRLKNSQVRIRLLGHSLS